MKLGKKHFLSRTVDNTDFVSWWYHSNNAMQFKLHMNNTTVTLHDAEGPEPVADFIRKLKRLHDALQALIEHPIGEPTNQRVWLNGEALHDQHMSGYFAWGYSDTLFYFTLADCHRAVRGQFIHNSRYGGQTVNIQMRLLKRITKHVANAIIDFTNLEPTNV